VDLERKLVLLRLRVAVLLVCIFNSLRIAKKIIAQLQKKRGVYSIVPDHTGGIPPGEKLCFIIETFSL
jgi:hypothetical protein